MGQPGYATGIARLRVLSTGEERQQPLMIHVCLSRATLPCTEAECPPLKMLFSKIAMAFS